MGLPGRCPQILEASRRSIVEDLFNLFERLLAGFWEQEKDVEEHCYAENPEDDVDFPTNVGECRWHEVGESEVECPNGKVSNFGVVRN